ncbi:MAG: GAF domain-containing protein [Anaerolineae bacterium]|nr:GAF domain-containing protein [Anaerolineae bacterium]
MQTQVRWRFWQARTIRAKLLIGFIALGVMLMLVVGAIAYIGVRSALQMQTLASLVAVRADRAAALEQWSGERRLDIETLAADVLLRQYVRELQGAVKRDASLGETMAARLDTLRGRYLDKPQLIDADDGSAYSRSHRVLYPILRAYLDRHGYYDVFIVSPDGDVLFTVVKEDDFGTNLVDGPYYDTNIAQAFEYIRQTKRASVMTDFEYYQPSDGPAAFIGAPIIDGTQFVGVLIFQVPANALNEILNGREGLGETDETYVVGDDGLFRNDSRFRTPDMPSTILNPDYKVDTVASLSAFSEGHAGAALITDYRGVPVLSAWQPVVLQPPDRSAGVTWALIAEIDQAEAFRPAQNLLVGLALVDGVVLAVLVGATVLVNRQITRSLHQLTQVASRVAAGDFSQQVEVVTQDEIGALAGALNQMAGELRMSIVALEARVAERTHSLQAAAEVSRATTLILDPQELMYRVVDMVRERFGLYYVGVFLVDEAGRYAVLQAGTGQAGQQMIVQGYKLEVGGASLIGQAVAKADALVERDIGQDKLHFRNPLLPKTRAEMALPLRSRGRVIGAMTIQGEDVAAFDEVNVQVMQTMADQVAAAIDNARLFAATEAALARAEAERPADGARPAWRQTDQVMRYEARQPGVPPRGVIEPAEIKQALEDQRVVAIRDPGAEHVALVGPVMLHGEVIGALGVYDQNHTRKWTDDEIALFEDILGRMALVAENRQLLLQTRARAEREQTLREISDKMQQARDVQALMRVTAEMLTDVLKGSRAYVHLGAALDEENENDDEVKNDKDETGLEG